MDYTHEPYVIEMTLLKLTHQDAMVRLAMCRQDGERAVRRLGAVLSPKSKQHQTAHQLAHVKPPMAFAQHVLLGWGWCLKESISIYIV